MTNPVIFEEVLIKVAGLNVNNNYCSKEVLAENIIPEKEYFVLSENVPLSNEVIKATHVSPELIIGRAYNLRQDDDGNLICDISITDPKNTTDLEKQHFFASGISSIHKGHIEGIEQEVFIQDTYLLNYIYINKMSQTN